MRTRVLISGGSFPRAREVEEILLDAGFDPAIATRAPDCLEVCRGGWPDILLLDGVGPLSEAGERCRAVRSEPGIAHLPILVLTDGTDPQENLLAFEAGADECLPRPSGPDMMIARLRSLAQWKDLDGEWRGLASEGGPGSDRSLVAALRPAGLILDADDRSRERLTGILSRDYQIFSTGDEGQALARLALGAFDFVLVGLPWADARASRLCQRIRLLEPRRHPRLLLVATGDEWRLQDLDEHGIDDVILRPVDRNEVLGRVRLACRKQQRTTMLRDRTSERQERACRIVTARTFQPPPDRYAA